MQRHIPWTVFSLVCAALAAGCSGESRVKITGSVLKNGQPYTVGKETLVNINFKSTVDDPLAPIHQARFTRSTGKFEVELPPGNYHLFYLITQNGESLNAPPEITEKVYELTKSQELDFEIK